MRVQSAAKRLIAVVIVVSGCASAPRGEAPVQETFGWMLGEWRTEGDTRYTVESWTADDSGVLRGTSRTIRDGRTTFEERMTIERRDGGIYFVAAPQGQPAHAFALLEVGARHAIFEDPEHDFPQRIRYTLEAPKVLVGQIEGRQGDRERSASWRYRAVE